MPTAGKHCRNRRGRPAFTDEGTISGWARQTVAQAVKLGLIQGYETGEFLPQTGLLREQAGGGDLPFDNNTVKKGRER